VGPRTADQQSIRTADVEQTPCFFSDLLFCCSFALLLYLLGPRTADQQSIRTADARQSRRWF
jgi:hypothetical protein